MDDTTDRDCAHPGGCNALAWLCRLEAGVMRWYCREHFIKPKVASPVVGMRLEYEEISGGVNKAWEHNTA